MPRSPAVAAAASMAFQPSTRAPLAPPPRLRLLERLHRLPLLPPALSTQTLKRYHRVTRASHFFRRWTRLQSQRRHRMRLSRLCQPRPHPPPRCLPRRPSPHPSPSACAPGRRRRCGPQRLDDCRNSRRRKYCRPSQRTRPSLPEWTAAAATAPLSRAASGKESRATTSAALPKEAQNHRHQG
ncbi:unnamed protein product [Ectocarpus sp. 12 AP-2014]